MIEVKNANMTKSIVAFGAHPDEIDIGVGYHPVKGTFNLGSGKFVFSVAIMILFASTIWIPSASGLPQQQQTSLGVKIINPARGQQVAIGKNLTLSGTASFNATSNCGVFVIVDGVRPYQKTTPIGQTGGNDYSKWKYTFTPAYAGTIREGINRITAKLLCQANPVSLTKFYSINVTGMNGIVPKQSSAITGNKPAVASLSLNSSSYLFHPKPLIPTNSNSSATSSSSGHHLSNGKSNKHQGGYCNYSDYKRNVCA
ncbi:MAG: hypothetical protein WA364_22810 [Candidatus Nitrosopolaris sp.]